MSDKVGARPSDQALASQAQGLGPTGFDPSRVDHQIWPFGHGVIVGATGFRGGVGTYIITAAPDGYTENEGGTPQDAWDASIGCGGPVAMLTFETAESARAVARTLDELAIAIEARSGETTQIVSTEGESAAIAQNPSPGKAGGEKA